MLFARWGLYSRGLGGLPFFVCSKVVPLCQLSSLFASTMSFVITTINGDLWD